MPVFMCSCWLLLLLPLLALLDGRVAGGFAPFAPVDGIVFSAGDSRSGAGCAGLAVGVAYLLLLPVRQARLHQQQRWQWLLEWVSTHTLVAPAMVLSVGLYIYCLPCLDLEDWGMWLVGLLNTLMVLPFAFQQLRPRLLLFDDQYHALRQSLKLTTRQNWQVEWPWLRSTFLAAFVWPCCW
ncbi:MAG: hypothetical protein R3E89_11845 [Thiolinea sp.]